MDKSKFRRFRSYEIVSGSVEEFAAARDGALVGASIARRKGWKVGQRLDLTSLLGIAFEVKGIFFAGNEEQDNTILADLEYVQDQYNARGIANTIVVKLDPAVKAEDVAAQIDALPLPTRTHSEAEKAFVIAMIEDLGEMMNLSYAVILLTLVVVLVSVVNAVSMSVRDRTPQLGMLRTLGFTRLGILRLVLLESALVALLGGLVGVGVAWLVLTLQEVTVQARTFNLEIALPWQVGALAIGMAAAVGLLGSVLPALRAARLNIVAAVGAVE